MRLCASLVTCTVSLVTERRDADQHEAVGPTLASTLDRLRAADVSVAEFVVAGGLSSFRPLPTYYVAEIRSGQPVQSFEGGQLFTVRDDAVAHAEALSAFGRMGVFELVPVVVFE